MHDEEPTLRQTAERLRIYLAAHALLLVLQFVGLAWQGAETTRSERLRQHVAEDAAQVARAAARLERALPVGETTLRLPAEEERE